VMLIILSILMLSGGTGFLIYRKYGVEGIESMIARLPFKKFRKAPGAGFKTERGAPREYPRFTPRAESKGHSRFLEKAKKEEGEMEQIFKAFGAKPKEEAKEGAKLRKLPEKGAAKGKKEDIFEKLSKVKGAKETEKKEESKKEDVFARLSQLKGKNKDKNAMEELRKMSKPKASGKK